MNIIIFNLSYIILFLGYNVLQYCALSGNVGFIHFILQTSTIDPNSSTGSGIVNWVSLDNFSNKNDI